MTSSLSHAYGNPNAAPVVNAPEAASAGRRVASVPPGQVPYMNGRCGKVKADGTVCVQPKIDGWDVCLGHTPKTKWWQSVDPV